MTMPQLSSSNHVYYVVEDDEIVGRYGPDLNGALTHLLLFGTEKSYPKKNEKKAPSRAIIPFRSNGEVQHPDSLLGIEAYSLPVNGCSPEQCAYWEDAETLERMQRVAKREYDMISPTSHYGHVEHIPTEYRRDVRNACYRHFELLSQELEAKDRSAETLKRSFSQDDSKSRKWPSTSDHTFLPPRTITIENLEEVNTLESKGSLSLGTNESR